jgi:hypothetical protein
MLGIGQVLDGSRDRCFGRGDTHVEVFERWRPDKR